MAAPPGAAAVVLPAPPAPPASDVIGCGVKVSVGPAQAPALREGKHGDGTVSDLGALEEGDEGLQDQALAAEAEAEAKAPPVVSDPEANGKVPGADRPRSAPPAAAVEEEDQDTEQPKGVRGRRAAAVKEKDQRLEVPVVAVAEEAKADENTDAASPPVAVEREANEVVPVADRPRPLALPAAARAGTDAETETEPETEPEAMVDGEAEEDASTVEVEAEAEAKATPELPMAEKTPVPKVDLAEEEKKAANASSAVGAPAAVRTPEPGAEVAASGTKDKVERQGEAPSSPKEQSSAPSEEPGVAAVPTWESLDAAAKQALSPPFPEGSRRSGRKRKRKRFMDESPSPPSESPDVATGKGARGRSGGGRGGRASPATPATPPTPEADVLENLDKDVLAAIDASAKVDAAAKAQHICICLAMHPFCRSDRARLDSLLLVHPGCHVVSVSQYVAGPAELRLLPPNFGHFSTNFKNRRSVRKRLKPLLRRLRQANAAAPIEVFFDNFWLENNCFANLYGMHWIETAFELCACGASRMLMPVDGGTMNSGARNVAEMLEEADYGAFVASGGARLAVSGLGLERHALALATMKGRCFKDLAERGGWRNQARDYLQDDCPFLELRLAPNPWPPARDLQLRQVPKGSPLAPAKKQKKRSPKAKAKRTVNPFLQRFVPAENLVPDTVSIVPVADVIEAPDLRTTQLPTYGARVSPRRA